MKLSIVKMEADSTTLECENIFDECSNKERENDIFFSYKNETSFYNRNLKPILPKECSLQLLEWMKKRRLIPATLRCQNCTPSYKMKMEKAKVTDKYQWQCKHCGHRVSVRENSVFKNTPGFSLTAALKMIQAWCCDMDYIYVSSNLGVRKQSVNAMFTKIEKIISIKNSEKLGGPESVVLVEMYPDGTVEHNPDSSRSDSDLTKHKILCLTDSKFVPMKYSMHVMTGGIKKKMENNNACLKKVKPPVEILDFITKNVYPGGYCIIGSSSYLNELSDLLLESGLFIGVTSVEILSSRSDSKIKEFMTDTVWRHAVTLCEAAQDLPKKEMQMYLDCALWRRKMSNIDMFPNVLEILGEQTMDMQKNKET